MGTKKGQVRKTARRAYEPKKKRRRIRSYQSGGGGPVQALMNPRGGINIFGRDKDGKFFLKIGRRK